MDSRETFTSRFGMVMTMIGVAVGLGNVWRFPYMVGKFGGATFVLFYVAFIFLIGIPALMAEWMLGRSTQSGPWGAFEKGGLWGGKYVGIFLFIVVICATGYYSNTVGWVGYFGICRIFNLFGGLNLDPSRIIPPQQGFSGTSFILQLVMTAIVIVMTGLVIVKGLRRGIERASKLIMPTLFVILLTLIFRSVTLPGASVGINWYIGSLQLKHVTGSVMAAALGQVIFSLSLGGTFMVVYGSYMKKTDRIFYNASLTSIGDLLAGLLAGLAIFPAVFAFHQLPDSGPDLIFRILPRTFDLMPMGWLFGFLFFAGLFGAAYLSDVAAFEVLVRGMSDRLGLRRKKAVWLMCGVVFLVAIPPMINLKVFLPWDLTFGSGMQTLGSFLAVITVMWCIKRSVAMKELAADSGNKFPLILFWWMRLVIPLSILAVGILWLLESVFGFNLPG